MQRWVLGARPKTLPAAVAPVLVGTAVAAAHAHALAGRAGLALVVALALQVGVNYANDYQDGVRGVDVNRVGPRRLVAAGLATGGQVRRAALVALGVAGLAGAGLAVLAGPWVLVAGVACIAAAWLYTGGPRPYGYAGFGELFVFVFFGVVAVAGTAFVQEGHLSLLALAASVPVGLLASALLIVNNLRDRSSDALSNKHTLAVRLGDRRTRLLYVGTITISLVWPAVLTPVRPWALVAMASAPLGIGPIRRVLRGATGPELISALGETARLQLVFAVVLAAGIWLR